MQISYQAGFHFTASDAWSHAWAQNLEHLKIYFLLFFKKKRWYFFKYLFLFLKGVIFL